MSVSRFNYFDLSHAVETHAFIIRESGGLPGVKNVGAIESVLTHAQNDVYYPKLQDKVAAIVYGINKNHAFNDGNKRASIALSSFFLELNGYDAAIPLYTRGMEEVAVWLACSLIDQNTLKQIITFLLSDDDDRIINFITEAKRYRVEILREQCRITKDLLGRIIASWLSESMVFDDDLYAEVLAAVLPEDFARLGDGDDAE